MQGSCMPTTTRDYTHLHKDVHMVECEEHFAPACCSAGRSSAVEMLTACVKSILWGDCLLLLF